MMNCREVTRLCSEERERSLTLSERIRLRLHLMRCDGCSNFRRQMNFLRFAIGRYRDGTRDDDAR